MALPTITLDDRSFDQLFAFMRKEIDTAQWVDHNLSDPGIVLLDLLCWIGEMISYRADQVPATHFDKFANLILDPPEPVTVPLTLTASLDAGRTQDLTVPAGTRFSTDFKPDPNIGRPRRFIFETSDPVTFPAPNKLPPSTTRSAQVTAREYLVVENEVLGVSDGTPNQMFPFRPIHTDLGLPLDAPVVTLLDFVHTGADYNPNPRVTVGAKKWALKQFLLTEVSRFNAAKPDDTNHFMVEPDPPGIRFGDNRFGTIPANGAKIVCTRYQLLQGPDALVPAGSLLHRLDPVAGLTVTEQIDFANGDAEGGSFFFSSDDRLREGLKRFRRPYRLITASDFERVMLIDFNELQVLSKAPDQVLRATALMNQRPQAPQQSAPGNVTILVLAAKEGVDLDDKLTDTSIAAAQKQALITLAPELIDKIVRFLDRRRLITTRIHLQSPALTLVSINTQVAVARERNSAEMRDVIQRRLRQFLGVIGGGFDGKGWPLGGSVYRSKLFRLIEDIDGVDHVESLALAPADASGDVPLGALSLPALAGLSVGVVRT